MALMMMEMAILMMYMVGIFMLPPAVALVDVLAPVARETTATITTAVVQKIPMAPIAQAPLRHPITTWVL